jgi:hypothetical protein
MSICLCEKGNLSVQKITLLFYGPKIIKIFEIKGFTSDLTHTEGKNVPFSRIEAKPPDACILNRSFIHLRKLIFKPINYGS